MVECSLACGGVRAGLSGCQTQVMVTLSLSLSLSTDFVLYLIKGRLLEIDIICV